MSPPDEENEGRTEFNANDERWTEEGLQPGGFSFTTLIHELGHGHGLAHPHDNGGHSGIMHGVESDGVAFSYTNGDFDLNQSVYTMMSYEDGWEKSPYGSAETTDPWLAGQPDGLRRRRHPGQVRRQRGMGDRQRHLCPQGRQRSGHLLFLHLGCRRLGRQHHLFGRTQCEYRSPAGDARI